MRADRARSIRRRCRRICRSRPQQIADAALAAAKEGAAILHLHARDPERRPSDAGPRRVSASFCRASRPQTDAVINITTGGSPHMTVAERLKPAHHFKPEVASLNMGSMNFGLYPMLDALQGVQARLGAQASGEQPRSRLQEHLRGYRIHPDVVRGERHALRVRVLRHLASVQPRAFRRSRARRSRRSSCRACSGCSAASARIPRTSRT